jgi:hypothetical protein
MILLKMADERAGHARSAPFALSQTGRALASKWLPSGHDCCVAATLSEDLTLIPASSCMRRFLATPLDEIILRRLTATALAKAKENPVFSRICIFRV